jgi:hypothetical protein
MNDKDISFVNIEMMTLVAKATVLYLHRFDAMQISDSISCCSPCDLVLQLWSCQSSSPSMIGVASRGSLTEWV